ncbi:hypothetical protein FHG87_019934 [Trinorchestia longiramus]|nr:hypothetical protein FHG87_019934 [Trinorchestia longiramus]
MAGVRPADGWCAQCEWLLLPLLESLEKSRGTTASHAAACKYLKRHPSHAPAFRAVLQHALAHWPTQTSTHVAIMKHVQLLSPGTEQVLTLAQTLLDDPRSYDTTSAEAAMGLTPLSREAAADDTSLRVSTVCASASEDLCNSSLVVRRKGQASVVACPLLKDVVVQSRVYCVRVLVRLLHVPHHQHALRPWELLSRALASLHRSWIRCVLPAARAPLLAADDPLPAARAPLLAADDPLPAARAP